MAAPPGRHCLGCAASSSSTSTTSSSSCWAVLRICHRRSGRYFTNCQDTEQLHRLAFGISWLTPQVGRRRCCGGDVQRAASSSSVSSAASSSCRWLRRACYGERAAPSCWRSGKLARHAPHSRISVCFLAFSSSAHLPVHSRMLRVRFDCRDSVCPSVCIAGESLQLNGELSMLFGLGTETSLLTPLVGPLLSDVTFAGSAFTVSQHLHAEV